MTLLCSVNNGPATLTKACNAVKKVVKIGNLGEGKVERKLSSVSPSDGECSLHGQLTTLFEIDR